MKMNNLLNGKSDTTLSDENGALFFAGSQSEDFTASLNDPLGITVLDGFGMESPCFTGATGTCFNETIEADLYIGKGIGSILFELVEDCNVSQHFEFLDWATTIWFYLYPHGQAELKFEIYDTEILKFVPLIEERINLDPQTNLHHWWGWSSHRIVFIFVGNITYVFDAPYADMQLGSSLHGMLSFRADDSHEWSSEDYAEFTQVYFHNNAAAICMKEENIRINDQIDGKIIDAERVLIKPEYVECYPFSGFALIKPTDETGAKNEKIH